MKTRKQKIQELFYAGKTARECYEIMTSEGWKTTKASVAVLYAGIKANSVKPIELNLKNYNANQAKKSR